MRLKCLPPVKVNSIVVTVYSQNNDLEEFSVLRSESGKIKREQIPERCSNLLKGAGETGEGLNKL